MDYLFNLFIMIETINWMEEVWEGQRRRKHAPYFSRMGEVDIGINSMKESPKLCFYFAWGKNQKIRATFGQNEGFVSV